MFRQPYRKGCVGAALRRDLRRTVFIAALSRSYLQAFRLVKHTTSVDQRLETWRAPRQAPGPVLQEAAESAEGSGVPVELRVLYDLL
jgi:hypothetical protein